MLLCMCPHPLLSWRESSCSAESTGELTVLQPGRCLIRNILELLSVTQCSLFKDLQPSVVVFFVFVCVFETERRKGRRLCMCDTGLIGTVLIQHSSDFAQQLNVFIFRPQIYFWWEVLLEQLYLCEVSLLNIPKRPRISQWHAVCVN